MVKAGKHLSDWCFRSPGRSILICALDIDKGIGEDKACLTANSGSWCMYGIAKPGSQLDNLVELYAVIAPEYSALSGESRLLDNPFRCIISIRCFWYLSGSRISNSQSDLPNTPKPRKIQESHERLVCFTGKPRKFRIIDEILKSPVVLPLIGKLLTCVSH